MDFVYPDVTWPQSLGNAGFFQICVAGVLRSLYNVWYGVSRVKCRERATYCSSFGQAGMALCVWLVLDSLWCCRSSAGQESTFPFFCFEFSCRLAPSLMQIICGSKAFFNNTGLVFWAVNPIELNMFKFRFGIFCDFLQQQFPPLSLVL